MAINAPTTSVTQISKPGIDEDRLINVAYSDPSKAAQYSEFLTNEDIDPQFEKEKPLFETLKDDPLTIGEGDVLGYGAGTNLWTLSEAQKEAREKQLGQLEGVPDLLFGWEGTGYGSLEGKASQFNIGEIGRRTEDEALFGTTDPTGTKVDKGREVSDTSVDPIEEQFRGDDRSWLEQQRDKLLGDPQRTKEQAQSLWNVVPKPAVSFERSTKPFKTGLSTTSTPSSVGTSAAPPASLAAAPRTGGAGLSPTGAPMYGSTSGALTSTASSAGAPITGSAGYGATVGAGGTAAAEEAAGGWGEFKSGALTTATQLLTIYGAKQDFDRDTSEGKFSGSLKLAALVYKPLAPFVAAYEALKWLTGWGGVGSWFPGGGYKHPMGGVEFRLGTEAGINDDSDNSKFRYPGADDYDQLIADDSLRIVAPYSWGYNGFPHPEVKKQAQKQIGYLYGFADRYGLDVNEDVFIKAATGTGGFEKHKPSGDRKVSVLERIDNIENGSTTANQWLREVMEYTGPNGQRIISGIPKSQNISTTTGLYEGFASQEEFQNDVAKYNTEYYG